MNKLIGIAVTDAAEGEAVAVQVEGVFSLPVAAANDIAVGTSLYWSSGNGEFTTTASGNVKAGYATTAAPPGVATAEIRLTPGVA